MRNRYGNRRFVFAGVSFRSERFDWRSRNLWNGGNVAVIRETAEELKRESGVPANGKFLRERWNLYEVQWNQLQREIQVSIFQQVRVHHLRNGEVQISVVIFSRTGRIMRKCG
jgi:hypothetical protein